MLRAHLIMNPEARGVTPSLQHLMATALEARFKLGVTETHARDAGVDVARDAVDSGAELLIASALRTASNARIRWPTSPVRTAARRRRGQSNI